MRPWLRLAPCALALALSVGLGAASVASATGAAGGEAAAGGVTGGEAAAFGGTRQGSGDGGAQVDQAAGTQALLSVLASEYKTADPTHEVAAAARVRTMALALEAQIAAWRQGDRAAPLTAPAGSAAELSRALRATEDRLQPWPLPLSVRATSARIAAQLRQAGYGHDVVVAKPYKQIDALLSLSASTVAAGTRGDDDGDGGEAGRRLAAAYAAEAYALYAAGPGKRLRASDPAVVGDVADAFWPASASEPGLLPALGDGRAASVAARASERASASIETAATVLGDRTIGKGSVVADAAVIVFREGLEAVLILAAITASFVGERRALRKPVLFGALLGLGATAITYVIAQALVDALGDGGLRLQAITGLIAIAVLLLVTNWFFHRVYWSEWLGRFHRRRKALERFDRFGFVSGQLVGFALLGLTSVYREGFETVLFLQNLQVSAGSQATVLGIAIGLAGTLAVGFVTFKLERKLPYKKMLIATGVLIGLVLAVMVGTTVHSLQGLGWVGSTPTGFTLQPWWGQWLGVYATWQGIGAQLAALLAVYGSYAAARQVQGRRRRRAAPEAATLARG
jgi:high-affinity iron transporter